MDVKEIQENHIEKQQGSKQMRNVQAKYLRKLPTIIVSFNPTIIVSVNFTDDNVVVPFNWPRGYFSLPATKWGCPEETQNMAWVAGVRLQSTHGDNKWSRGNTKVS